MRRQGYSYFGQNFKTEQKPAAMHEAAEDAARAVLQNKAATAAATTGATAEAATTTGATAEAATTTGATAASSSGSSGARRTLATLCQTTCA